MLTALVVTMCCFGTEHAPPLRSSDVGADLGRPSQAEHAPPPRPAAETIVAIQVHGNTISTDEEIRSLSGVAIGAAVSATTVDEVIARLRASKRFEQVEVLKRFASLTDPSQIMLVIIVDDGPVHIKMTGDPDEPARVVRNRWPKLLFLPVLNAEDGYGLTYGVRFATSNPAGAHSRVAFPLTWGGEKRAALEFDKQIENSPNIPIDRVLAGAAVSRRTNPFFDQDDDRVRTWVRAEREIVHGLRAGATAGWQHITFMNQYDQVTDAGGDVILDTRVDPVLARNAVYVRGAWTHLHFADPALSTGVLSANRTELDARGYLGVFRQNILAVRVQRQDSDVPLPPYLKPLLGGMDSLRGFHAGSAAGDTLVAMSAELIVPLTSPLSVGKIGVSAFVDRGTVYTKGERFADQTLKDGYGGSVWFAAAFLRLNVAVAHGVGATTRVHVGATASF
ncbi:MAG: BamA/TamA family outer membrane protein [Acidobacteria bacterium]|nr:BamA/TamA family outer membrane protein [Acidobacteriota bacterium]